MVDCEDLPAKERQSLMKSVYEELGRYPEWYKEKKGHCPWQGGVTPRRRGLRGVRRLRLRGARGAAVDKDEVDSDRLRRPERRNAVAFRRGRAGQMRGRERAAGICAAQCHNRVEVRIRGRVGEPMPGRRHGDGDVHRQRYGAKDYINSCRCNGNEN